MQLYFIRHGEMRRESKVALAILVVEVVAIVVGATVAATVLWA